MYLGIDLGTSNSVIAGIIDGKARIFRPADGGDVLPSVIFIDKRGHKLYGRRAHDQAQIAPENVAMGFKRLMGSSTPINISGANITMTPEECSAEILKQLVSQALTETGSDKITGAVITIPAAFNQMQSEATLRAAKLAGLERVDLLQEPVAAALSAMEGAKRSGRFLIYDLGGGTFDVALAESLNGSVKIIAHQGITMLGGRDFDRMIVNEIIRPWLAETFDLPEDFHREAAYRRLIRIAQLAAEEAKIELSANEETTIVASEEDIRLSDQSEDDVYLDVPFTRARFEELIREPVMQTVAMIRGLLTENNASHEEIDRIVFIGGPSRIPLIRQMVSNELGIAADLKTDPMTAVAIGAAYYAESREWGADNTSSAKPTTVTTSPTVIASTDAPATKELPAISFDYTSRTANDKTVVTLKVGGDGGNHQIRLKSKNWDSGELPLIDGMTIAVPLKEPGPYSLTAEVLDEKGKHMPAYDQTLTITRLVAATDNIPAAQTIAVKALDHSYAKENTFVTIVKKGDSLPADGKISFKSGRTLKSQDSGSIAIELFQVEYPDRIDLNLCVGLFQVHSEDLPSGYVIKEGSPITFNWKMNDGGIMQATVTFSDEANGPLTLDTPRFYAPQAGQVSFAGEAGKNFAKSIISTGEEELGDLVAALGPEGGPEVQLLKMRLQEQRETLDDDNDAETARRVAEEARFIRQDIARQARKSQAAMLSRRFGKITAVFNRIARSQAEKVEAARFDNYAHKIQTILDEDNEEAFDDAERYLQDMRDLFFSVAWRDPNYVHSWFKRLRVEAYLFPDPEEFAEMVKQGDEHLQKGEADKLRDLVKKMLAARIAMNANSSANEPATIIKG